MMLEWEMPVRVSEHHPSSGLWSILLYTYCVDSAASYKKTHSKAYCLQTFCNKESEDNARSAGFPSQSPGKISTLSLDTSCQNWNGGTWTEFMNRRKNSNYSFSPKPTGAKGLSRTAGQINIIQRQGWIWNYVSLFCYTLFLLVNLNISRTLRLFNVIRIHRPPLPTGKIHQYPRTVRLAK